MWALPAIGGGVQAYGTYQSGKRDANALNAQAGVAQQQGLADEYAQRHHTRQVMGEQAASFAQAGGGGDAGITRQSALMGEFDALNIRYGAQMRANTLRSNARAVRKDSRLLAGAQLLSAAGQAYSGYNLAH